MKNKILIGITLFSMFFGAGNLIFPPFLGAEAGTSGWLAFVGLSFSAVCFPILGVVAVTLSGGADRMADRVHPMFSVVFISALYLAIGPCLAIPRTSGTSFSMAVQPFLPEGMPVGLVQLIYSIIFFTVAARIALHPERLTEYLGKRLTPILLTLIVIIFVVSQIHPTGSAAAPVGMYASAPVIYGFQYGYQTMDALAALTFGTVIALNIREQGITEEKAVVKETISAGWIAGGCLILVYAMLNYVGMLAGGAFTGMENGTDVLLLTVHTLFGNAGTLVLALVFLIACFNTCVSLLSCCGKYFNELFPQISFPHWVFLFAGLSMLISNVGLNTILKVSVPVLNAIYPPALLLIFLTCINRWIKRYPKIYPWSAFLCCASSITLMLEQQGILVPLLLPLLRQMPGYTGGFAWFMPTIAGILVGLLHSAVENKNIANH